MTPEERAAIVEIDRIDRELERRAAGRKLGTYFPDTGPLRRELYPKHLEFFRLGATKRERLFLAANRVGKTEGAGGFEVACHLTGRYPSWWTGRRFDRPNQWWAAGDTRQTVRDILQRKLLGKPGEHGTGLIPKDCLERVANAPGIPDAVETVWVKHASGLGHSVLGFKSYDQKRESFQGTEQDGIWLDEEPPADVYTECLLRTMTNGGMVLLTFTPLRGMSEVVLSFLPGGAIPEKQDGSKGVVSATWDDVPHLSDAVKADLLASIPPFQRDARSKGLPQLGAGLIYPVPESTLKCEPFEIPKHWKRAYGMDVGWNRTAVVWGAIDPETDVAYVYSEHYEGEAPAPVHASAIKARGPVPGAIDPASAGASQADGRSLIQLYREQGLDLTEAQNAVEAGLFATWERFSSQRLKVFSTCQNTLTELRLYRRDEKGKVIKEKDHACFAPDTMVETRGGARRIVDLLGTEGEVLTSGGAWARYQNVRMTRANAPVVMVQFDDGRSVTCTPDHRFLTPEGWVPAAELVGLSVYDAVSQRIQRRAWTPSSFLRPAKSFWDAATTCAASTFSAMASACIASCGALLTGRFLTALTSTIGTRTAATTLWPISSSSSPTSTQNSTTLASRASSPRAPWMQPRSGTPVQRAASGTASTTRSTEALCIARSVSGASTAASALSHRPTDSTASAPTGARPSRVSRLAWTTRNVLASSAASLSWRIATRRSAPARALALPRCSSVTAAGSSDVYCLEVPGTHAFAVAGGLVAHNCDALRYLVMTGLSIARAPVPLEQKSEPQFSYSFGGGGSWMG